MNKKLAIGMGMMILLVLTSYAATFDDNSQSDFGNGTYNNTFYNSSGFVQLNATYNNGTFISRIFQYVENKDSQYDLSKKLTFVNIDSLPSRKF